MWIKQPVENFTEKKSGIYHTNFLWKSDAGKIYISDNHLHAGWCWLQECNPNDEYNFFHIDAHNDLMSAPSAFIDSVVANMSLKDYEDSHPIKLNTIPYVNWANYISVVAAKYPQWFNNVCFSTQEKIESWQRDSLRSIPIYKFCDIDLAAQIETVILNASLDSMDFIDGFYEKRKPRKWILNLDLDYFFMKDWNGSPQYLTDEFVHVIGKQIVAAMNRIHIFTIALSPECCGGWNNSFHILENLSTEIQEIQTFIEDIQNIKK